MGALRVRKGGATGGQKLYNKQILQKRNIYVTISDYFV